MIEFDRDWNQLPIAELQQLDAVCVRFEQALADDPEIRIESFVADLTGPQQRLVVLELVQIEIERRQARGELPIADEYALRFPRWADELRALIAPSIEEFDRAGSTATPETVNAHTSSDNDTKSKQPARVNAFALTGEEPSELHKDWGVQWRSSAPGPSRAGLPEDGVLGQYRLQEVLGRGGMGIVVRAHDTELAREVAIKFLTAEILQDATAKERFLREARAAAAVRHNHVVTIYAVQEICNLPLLVMELIDGITLEEYMRADEKLAADEIASLAYQIAQGLAAAHQRGLTHRDVKPANILLQKDDRRGGAQKASSWHIKIADFGLALATAEARLTGSGLAPGTPQYMSPEQADGGEIDSRSDLFSLGSVMYAMCAGRAPFEAESPLAIVRQVADIPARSLREINPEIPGWLVAIIEKLMAKSPDDRVQSAAEIADLLGRHLDDLPLTRCGDIAADTASTGASVHHRRTGPLVALAIIGFAAAAVGLVMSARDNQLPEVVDVPTLLAERAEIIAASAAATAQARRGSPANAPAPAIAPFLAKQAKAHQAAWANYLGVEVEITNSVGMKFRLIPPGEFLIGSSDEEIAKLTQEAEERQLHPWYIDRIVFEGSQHPVTLTKPFAMSIHEVTRGQFRQFVEATGYETDAQKDGLGGNGWKDGDWVKDPQYLWYTPVGFDVEQTDDHPLVNVSWNDARAFCQWLSESEGLAYRLPSEAEWEYACRAGSETRYCYGEEETRLDDHGWHLGNSGRNTNPVGQKMANAFGLFDMYGNVFEWCQDDWYGLYPKASAVNPTGIAVGMEEYEFSHLLRGSSFSHPASEVRSALRRSAPATFRNATIGFRPIRTYDQASRSTFLDAAGAFSSHDHRSRTSSVPTLLSRDALSAPEGVARPIQPATPEPGNPRFNQLPTPEM